MKLIATILTIFLAFTAPANLITKCADSTDAEMIARCLWGECRGAPSTQEKAAVAWCILNRVDDERWPNTIKEVITQPTQFTGYFSSNPIDEEFLWLANDVLDRWEREKAGEEGVGRVLPRDYCYFVKGHGRQNNFSTTWPVGNKIWDWSLEDPYEEIEKVEEVEVELELTPFIEQYQYFEENSVVRPDTSTFAHFTN